MLQEAILSLTGIRSGFITDDGELKLKSTGHPGERDTFEKICKISADYSKLKSFAAKHRLWTEETAYDDGILNGMYMCAFCEGLEQLFESYWKDVIQLEEDALENTQFVLSTVLFRVSKYATLFEKLISAIDEIKTMKIHGSRLLTFLTNKSMGSTGDLRNSYQRIASCCHTVLFKQLAEWLLRGHLADPHEEFFIKKSEDTPHADIMIQSPDETSDSVLQEKPYSLASEFSKYEVFLDMLPCYISASVANKILFVGQIIKMFDTDPKNKLYQSDDRGSRSVWVGREAEFLRKLHDLQDINKFSLSELDSLVDDIQSCVTTHLWHLAVEEANLFLELKIVKDFYLLGRGELFHEFIRLGGNILERPPTESTKRDLNSAFHIAVRKVLMNEEIPTEKFSFSLSLEDQQDSGWNGLSLNYKVNWPLHVLFTEPVLRSYNDMFGFLLRIRKVQMHLHDVWVYHTKFKSEEALKSRLLALELCKNLSFVIDNLQYYLQVDVLESQYAILESLLHSTKDFEMVRKYHTSFLANILSQSFLLVKKRSDSATSEEGLTPLDSEKQYHPLYEILMKLLRLCEKFCGLITFTWDTCLETNTELKLLNMKQEYEQVMVVLLRTLSGMDSHPHGSHLRQLLLRLDYNHWFSHHLTSS